MDLVVAAILVSVLGLLIAGVVWIWAAFPDDSPSVSTALSDFRILYQWEQAMMTDNPMAGVTLHDIAEDAAYGQAKCAYCGSYGTGRCDSCGAPRL